VSKKIEINNAWQVRFPVILPLCSIVLPLGEFLRKQWANKPIDGLENYWQAIPDS
jgi:hypothetical protein